MVCCPNSVVAESYQSLVSVSANAKVHSLDNSLPTYSFAVMTLIKSSFNTIFEIIRYNQGLILASEVLRDVSHVWLCMLESSVQFVPDSLKLMREIDSFMG